MKDTNRIDGVTGVRSLAKAAGVSPSTVADAIRDGRIPPGTVSPTPPRWPAGALPGIIATLQAGRGAGVRRRKRDRCGFEGVTAADFAVGNQ